MNTGIDIDNNDEREDLDFDRQNTEDDGKYEGKYENNRLGPLIKQAREALGYSCAQVADLCGMTEEQISSIETSAVESKISTLRKIIEVGLGGTLEFTIRL